MKSSQSVVAILAFGILTVGQVNGYIVQQPQYQQPQPQQHQQQQYQQQPQQQYQQPQYQQNYAPPPAVAPYPAYPVYPGYFPEGPVDPGRDEADEIYRQNQHRPRD